MFPQTTTNQMTHIDSVARMIWARVGGVSKPVAGIVVVAVSSSLTSVIEMLDECEMSVVMPWTARGGQMETEAVTSLASTER
jgi:hypothetical protein